MFKTNQDVLEYYKKKGLQKTFCPVPFSTLVFEADGQVCLCRQKGNNFAVGDITKQTLEEIWNGKIIQDIRKEFLTGNIKTCANEINRDQCNSSVERAHLTENIELLEIQKKLPVVITPNFNGKCNLECPMCHVWQQPNGIYDQVSFWEKLEKEMLPHLVEIDSFSGEPFIQKVTFRLIDLASSINPQIVWSFTTNGNWRFNNRLKSYLDKIILKYFIFSIDSLNQDTYPKIRKNGNLDKVLTAFDDILKYKKIRLQNGLKDFDISINFTLQKDNWRELPDILVFQKKHDVILTVRCLVEPCEFSVLLYSNDQKKQMLEFYISSLNSNQGPLPVSVINPLLESLEPIDRAWFFTEYKRKLVTLTASQTQYNSQLKSMG